MAAVANVHVANADVRQGAGDPVGDVSGIAEDFKKPDISAVPTNWLVVDLRGRARVSVEDVL